MASRVDADPSATWDIACDWVQANEALWTQWMLKPAQLAEWKRPPGVAIVFVSVVGFCTLAWAYLPLYSSGGGQYGSPWYAASMWLQPTRIVRVTIRHLMSLLGFLVSLPWIITRCCRKAGTAVRNLRAEDVRDASVTVKSTIVTQIKGAANQLARSGTSSMSLKVGSRAREEGSPGSTAAVVGQSPSVQSVSSASFVHVMEDGG